MFIVDTKFRIIAGAIIAGLLMAGAVGLYLKGRSDGVALTEAKVAQEKLKWERIVADNQIKHETQVAMIQASYASMVDQYKNEIAKLAENPKVVERYINRYIPVNTQCTIPQGFVELHNQSAAGAKLNDNPVNSGVDSKKSLSEVGSTVAENYYNCNDVRARLQALQQIVIQYQKQQKELPK